MALVTALLLGCSPSAEDPFLLPEADLGTPVAASEGYALTGGDEAWLAAAQLLPDQLWADPGYELPLAIWDRIYDDESIADEGSCPYIVADGPTLTWVSNCRSQEGYDWSGTVSRTEDETDGRPTTLWEMDLEIIADTDFPRFSHIKLSGTALSTDSQCPGEPDGPLTLTGNGVAEFAFDGLSGLCDSCAPMTLDGADLGEVCLH